MRGFFAAAIASFVGGILVIIVQMYVLQKQPMATVRQIQIATNKDNLSLTAQDVAKFSSYFNSSDSLERAVRKDDNLEISTFIVRNSGTADLSKLTFELNSSPTQYRSAFLAYQATSPRITNPASFPGKAQESIDEADRAFQEALNSSRQVGTGAAKFKPDIRVEGTSLSYKIPLLKIHEETTVTVVASPVSFPKPSLRQEGVDVKIDESSPIVEETMNETDLSWLYSIAFALGTFFLGIGVSEYFHREALKKIGFDYDEVIKLYREAEKKDG